MEPDGELVLVVVGLAVAVGVLIGREYEIRKRRLRVLRGARRRFLVTRWLV